LPLARSRKKSPPERNLPKPISPRFSNSPGWLSEVRNHNQRKNKTFTKQNPNFKGGEKRVRKTK